MTRKIRNYTIVAICSVFMIGLIGGTAMAGSDNLHYKGGQYYNGAAQSGNVADTQSVQQFNTKSPAGNVGGDNMHYQGGQYYYDVAKFDAK